MDFSKIKKIFYIVAIISMLLSIKSRVFGAVYFYQPSNTVQTVDLSTLLEHSNNKYIYFSANCMQTVSGEELFFYEIVASNNPFEIDFSSATTSNYAKIRFQSGSKWCATRVENVNLTTLQNNLNTYNFSPFDNFGSTYTLSTYCRCRQDQIADINTYPLFTNFVLKDTNGNIYNQDSSATNPFFSNPEELEDAPETVFIELGDYSSNDYLYFHLLEVTNIMPMSNNDSTYYYNDKTFALNKDSKYYTQLFDTNVYYYAIPRSALGLNPNTSYFYVLTRSGTQIDNSINPITEGDDIFDVIMQDTTGIITEDMATNDKLQNINQEFNDYQQQQQEFQNQNTLLPETETDINTNMNFNNSAPNFSNMYGSFFSRLSSTISGLGSYDPTTIETINLPIPFTQNTIPLTSNMISQHMPTILTTLFTTFWLFIFGKYFLAYILYIYRLISSGHILDNINSNNEIITNDVL